MATKQSSKVKLCGKQGQTDAEWAATLKDAAAKIEANPEMPQPVKDQLSRRAKAEIAKVEAGRRRSAPLLLLPPVSAAPYRSRPLLRRRSLPGATRRRRAEEAAPDDPLPGAGRKGRGKQLLHRWNAQRACRSRLTATSPVEPACNSYGAAMPGRSWRLHRCGRANLPFQAAARALRRRRQHKVEIQVMGSGRSSKRSAPIRSAASKLIVATHKARVAQPGVDAPYAMRRTAGAGHCQVAGAQPVAIHLFRHANLSGRRGGTGRHRPRAGHSRTCRGIVAALDGRTLAAIACTHTHRDHSPASRALKEATGAPIIGCAPLVLESIGPRADASFDKLLCAGPGAWRRRGHRVRWRQATGGGGNARPYVEPSLFRLQRRAASPAIM